jgi:Flp pilus assembly protein TadG
MLSLIEKFHRRNHANALIETALILPIIILMMLAVLDFSVLLNLDLRVADSARSAAEAATYRPFATNAQNVEQVVASGSASGIPNYATSIVNYCTCANGVAGSASCNDHSSCGTYGIPNQYVKVTATATLPLIFGIKGFPASINVQSVAIARTPWTGTN